MSEKQYRLNKWGTKLLRNNRPLFDWTNEADDIVDLLNASCDEIKELKQKVDFYKYFQKDARELEKENEHLKKRIERLERKIQRERTSAMKEHEKWEKEVIELIRELRKFNDDLSKKNEQLKQRNNRQTKQLNRLYCLIEEKDWIALSDIIDDFKKCEEQLQKEWGTYCDFE